MAVSLAFANLAFQFNNVKVGENPLCFGLAPTQLPYLCKERRRYAYFQTLFPLFKFSCNKVLGNIYIYIDIYYLFMVCDSEFDCFSLNAQVSIFCEQRS
jgi:hypothetical protein